VGAASLDTVTDDSAVVSVSQPPPQIDEVLYVAARAEGGSQGINVFVGVIVTESS
jgi:hypothetical protein